MNTEQPLAMALAEELDRFGTVIEHHTCAAELRRLHAENIELAAKVRVAESGFHAAVQTAKWQESTNSELNRHIAQKAELRAENEALREALQAIVDDATPWGNQAANMAHIARAALARAGEVK